MFGRAGVSPRHSAIIGKLDEIHEKICNLLVERPVLFPKRNVNKFNVDWVKDKIDVFYTYPKKQMSDGNKVIDTTSENKTVYLKVKYYENSKKFGTNFVNIMGKQVEKKRKGVFCIEPEYPLDDNGDVKFGRNLRVHAAVVNFESFFISGSKGEFHKSLVADTIYAEPGDSDNYEFEILNQDYDEDVDYAV